MPNKRVEPVLRTRASPTCSAAHAQREWCRLKLMYEPISCLIERGRRIFVCTLVRTFSMLPPVPPDKPS
jgi:hypothetical protein